MIIEELMFVRMYTNKPRLMKPHQQFGFNLKGLRELAFEFHYTINLTTFFRKTSSKIESVPSLRNDNSVIVLILNRLCTTSAVHVLLFRFYIDFI